MKQFEGELRIGAIYASHDPRISRRITQLRHDCVYYVYHEKGKRPVETGMPEELFRQFTANESHPDVEK